MVGEHVAHAVTRAFAPQRDNDAVAGRLPGFHVRLHGFEYVAALLRALGREIASGPCRSVDHVGRTLGRGERREAHERPSREP